MVDRNVSFGPITVTFGNVATWCGRMLQPASGAGVQVLGYTFSVAYTAAWSQVNPALMDLGTDGSGLVPVGTWLQANDSFVTMLRRTVPPPNGSSSNHDALAVNIVPYALNPADEGSMVAPCAIGSPSNPAILAHRQSPLWFNGPPVADMPSVIDLDVLAPIAGWPGWGNTRPTMAEVLPRWAGYCGELWGGGWGFASRLPATSHSRGGYGHYYSGKVSDGMLMALSKEGTADERKELARRITQWGVDTRWAFELGRNDGVDGGHYNGRQGLIIWAGHFLQDSEMLSCVSRLPGQLNEAEQFYTTSPKAWVWTDRTWPYGYKGKSEDPTNLLAPVNQWGTHFPTMLYLTGYFQPVVGSQVGTALAMQILGRTAEMGVAHRGMVAQFMEGPGPANLAAIDDIVITCIDPRDGQVFDDGHPRDILWGYSDSPDDHNGFGRAAWIAYSSYAPPATTVVTYDHSAHASPRYSATVNGDPLPIWGRTTDTQGTTPYWTGGANIDQSGATFCADGPVDIVVMLESGSITAAKVYTNDPSGPVIPSTVVSGKLLFTHPERTVAWCEINGLRAQPLILRNLPPITQPTGPTVDVYNGTQTSATAGRTMVFPPGTHTIGKSFPVPAGASVWLHGEAWVVGSFHNQGSAGGHAERGHGILSGEWGSSLRSTIRALPTHDEMVTYSLIYGEFSITNPSIVEGITLLDPPFYTTYFGVSEIEDVLMVGPWWGNSDAFNIAQQGPSRVGHAKRNCAWIHDNVIFLEEYLGGHVYDNNIVGSVASSAVHISFWPLPETTPDTHSGTNNTIVCFYATSGIVKAWCDGSDTAHVVKGGNLTKLRFVGSVIFNRAFWIENRLYPIEWGPQALGLGQITEWTFSDVTFETVPTQKSIIKGWDINNAPSKIAFNEVYFAGTRMTAANFLDYFEIDGFVREITVDGVRVDLIRTTGSASVAVGASGTSGVQIVGVGGALVSISTAGAAALQLGAVGSATIPIGASGFSTVGVVPPPVIEVPSNVPRGPGSRPWTRRRRPWWTWLAPW